MEGFPQTLDALIKTPEGIAMLVSGLLALVIEMFPQFQNLSAVRKRTVVFALVFIISVAAEAARAFVLEPGMPFTTAAVYSLIVGALAILWNQVNHLWFNAPGSGQGIAWPKVWSNRDDN